MDEREVRELLANAADAVVPSPDLSARAERRFLRRRFRARVVVGTIVTAVIGSGVVTAALIGHQSPVAVAPAPTSTPQPTVNTATSTTRPTVTASTTTSVPSAAVDLHRLTALSFVDARVGFALSIQVAQVARTDDGGRTWRQVGMLDTAEPFLHFENGLDGVAWGTGPLQVTTDGGRHWHSGDGPVDNDLAWAQGRLWAMSPCVQSTPCGARPLLISDDVGLTWRRTAALRQGFGQATLVVVSKSHAYVVEPSTDTQPGPSQLAVTRDSGTSWHYEPVPCGSDTEQLYLAATPKSLLLICAAQPGSSVLQQYAIYTSPNEGRTWTPRTRVPGPGNISSITQINTRWILAMLDGSLWSSDDDARTWQPKIAIDPSVGGSWSLSTVPNAGIWAAHQSTSSKDGVWFSADGTRWQHRTRG